MYNLNNVVDYEWNELIIQNTKINMHSLFYHVHIIIYTSININQTKEQKNSMHWKIDPIFGMSKIEIE